MAAIMIVSVKFLPDIVSTVKGGKSLVEYPQSLLDLLERNPETKDFVLDYPVNKDIDFETILANYSKETNELYEEYELKKNKFATLDKDLAKKIIKIIKDAKLKVDAKINEDTVRVTGKKKDDLQTTIALVRSSKIEQPLQYENFRD